MQRAIVESPGGSFIAFFPRLTQHGWLLRYCARPPFALERLSVIRGPDGRIARIRYVLPRRWVIMWAANWVGRGRSRTSTRPGASGVVEVSPFEFLDRLAELVPPTVTPREAAVTRITRR